MRVLAAFALIIVAANAVTASKGDNLVRLGRSRYDKIDAPGCGQRPLAPGNGVSELATRIVGGKESMPYTWPAMCSLRFVAEPTTHLCGASLIKNLAGEYYLATAAQCLNDTRASRYEAHCGIHDRADVSEPHRVIAHFSSLFIHGGFNSWTLDYDIALFKVSSNMPTNMFIAAVCIPNEGWNDGEISIVAGWGSLTAGGTTPYKLHQVNKPIKSRSICEQRYGVGAITPRMLCAGLPTGGVDACVGDSGGPLYTYIENRWTLTGIVSWGHGCGEAGKPGVYSDVIELKDWMNSIINGV